MKNKLEELNDKSNDLYQKYIEDDDDDDTNPFKAPDPVQWLFNQDNMRNMWKDWIKNLPENEILKNVLIDNSFHRYMNFMYENYPSGFGNCVKRGMNPHKSYDRLFKNK